MYKCIRIFWTIFQVVITTYNHVRGQRPQKFGKKNHEIPSLLCVMNFNSIEFPILLWKMLNFSRGYTILRSFFFCLHAIRKLSNFSVRIEIIIPAVYTCSRFEWLRKKYSSLSRSFLKFRTNVKLSSSISLTYFSKDDAAKANLLITLAKTSRRTNQDVAVGS